MLEILNSSVVVVDLLCAWHTKQPSLPPFIEWWESMSEERKRSMTFKVLVETYGDIFQEPEITIGEQNGK